MTLCTRLLALLVLLLVSPALAQKNAQVPDTDPEVERQSFEVADGFEVNLFASDPDIAKPIQMNFDAQGRLWVASSSVYPQLKPGEVADDKILILEDTDHNGQADKFTTFADGLLIPTGLEPGNGGVYAANSTELLFMQDTNGDGKADSRRVVLAGFGTEDTHHILHTFRWGNDGFLYFNQSIYIHSTVETPWGPRYLGGGGTWQFRPDSIKLEVFTRGLVNPWGHAINRWGQHFATDGAGGEGINDMIPGASFVTTPNEKRIIAGMNPGSPKYCGLEILSGRAMPDDMQGILVTNDFRANRVCRFQLSEDGSSYSSRELPELIKTRFAAFRPVDVKMGPDGALYIADWYNPIIQHGEVDFRDPRRDHTHGRIWRVTAKNRPLVERPNLTEKNVDQLLDALRAPESWTRHFANRQLSERDPKTVLPALAKWVEALEPDDVHAHLEALWLYQSLAVPRPDLLRSLLNSPDHHARSAAVRVIPHWQDSLDDALTLLAQRVEDEHPRVRLEAVRALEQFSDPRAVEIALRALDHPVDKTLDYALWLTARNLQSRWLPELQAGNLDFDGNPRRLAFALQAAGSPKVVAPLLQAVEAGTISAERAPEIFRLVGALGSPDDLAQGLKVALASKAAAQTLSALIEGARPRAVRPSRNLDALAKVLNNPDDLPARLAAASAAGVWKVEPLRDDLTRLALDPASPLSLRAASIEALGRLGGPSASETLTSLGRDPRQPASLRLEATQALATVNLRTSASLAADLLASNTPDTLDIASLISTFAGRKGGPAALASALKDKTLARDVATLAVRAAKASGQPESALTDALSRAGKLDAPAPPPSPEEVQKMAAAVLAEGDPARGEALFRRDSLKCLSCHAIAGAGSQVGPGLESIGASASGRLPHRLPAPAQQGRQGRLPLHRRRHRRRPRPHRHRPRPRRPNPHPPRRRRQANHPRHRLHRGGKARRIPHALRPHRLPHPPRVPRPRPLPLRAGQGRPLRRLPPPVHPALGNPPRHPGRLPGPRRGRPRRRLQRPGPHLDPRLQHRRRPAPPLRHPPGPHARQPHRPPVRPVRPRRHRPGPLSPQPQRPRRPLPLARRPAP